MVVVFNDQPGLANMGQGKRLTYRHNCDIISLNMGMNAPPSL